MRVEIGWVVVAVGALLSVAGLLSWAAVDGGAAPFVGNVAAACLTAFGTAILWKRWPVARWIAVALTCGTFTATWVSYGIYDFRTMPRGPSLIAPRN